MTPDHSAAVQAISSAINTPLLLATLFFSLRTLRIGGRQAEAAENAAEVGIKQLAVTVNGQDKATQPILVFELSSDQQSAKIRNVGLGPALNVQVTFAAAPQREIFCVNDVLGIGHVTEVFFQKNHVNAYGLRVMYESALGRKHECNSIVHPDYLEFRQIHVTLPHPMDELWDVKFKD